MISALSLALAAHAADKTAKWDAALKNIATYEHGQSHAGLIAVEHLVRTARPAERTALERRLIAALKSGATAECKRFVCRQLALIGSAEAVPALAALLNDPDLADMARYALEPIHDPAVDRALLSALPKTSGKLKIGVINSLGARCTPTAIASLGKLAWSSDEAIARAVISALEKIKTTSSLDALQQAYPKASESLRPHIADCALAVAHALLTRGEKQAAEKALAKFYQPSYSRTIRTAALQGLLAVNSAKYFPLVLAILRSEQDALQPFAADTLRKLPGTDVVAKVAGELPKYSPNVQALVLTALAQRGDATALPAVLNAANSPNEPSRLAAMQAIGTLGGAAQVPLLVEFVAGDNANLTAAARSALARLRGPEVNGAILKSLADKPAQVQNELIQVLAVRNAVSTVPTLLQMAKSAAPETRATVFRAVGSLAGEAHLPGLIELVAQASDAALSEAAEQSLTAAVTRFDDASQWSQAILAQYSKAAVSNRCALLRVLKFSGDSRALALIRQELKSGDETLRDAALRTMAEWANADAADDLLKLARDGANMTQRVLAFRGVVRMGELTAKTSAESGLKLLRSAMNAAPRVEDKRLVLGALARMGRRDALDMALACLDNPKLVNEASSAALKISDAICAKQPDTARGAAEKVLAVTKNEKLKKQAQTVLGKIKSSRVTE